MVQRFDDEAQETLVGQCLAGDVDRAVAPARQLYLPGRDRGKRGIDDPAIDLRHQLVAFGRSQEFRRVGGASMFGGHADQYFDRRPRIVLGSRAASGGNDGLYRQFETVFMQRRLHLPQPLYVAALPRYCLVARGIHVHLSAAALLRDITGGIRGAHEVLQATARVTDLYEADRNSDIENLVLPDEAIVGDRDADIRSNLPRLFDRTAYEECAELIAAESPDEVRVADLVLYEVCHFPEHVVAGLVPAAVVDRLEAIKVHVREHVHAFLGMRGIHRILQAPLEFAPVLETGQGIVRGVVAHLLRQATDLAHVVKDDHRTGYAVAGATNRGCGDFDGVLLFTIPADQQRAPTHVYATPHRKAALDRVTERAPVRFIDEGEELADLVSRSLLAVRSGHRFRRPVQVVDAAFVVRRGGAFRHRLRRVRGLPVAAAPGNFEALPVADVTSDGKGSAGAAIFGRRALRLPPGSLRVAVDQLYL